MRVVVTDLLVGPAAVLTDGADVVLLLRDGLVVDSAAAAFLTALLSGLDTALPSTPTPTAAPAATEGAA